MILDIHTHHHLGKETRAHPCPVEPIIALAKQAGITRINLLGNLMRNGSLLRPPRKTIQSINSRTMEQVAQYPDFLTGFCYLNPVLDKKFLLDEMDRCLAQGNLCGVKFEIDLNCRDARYDPLLERARELEVPILHHCWYFHGRDYGQDYASDPADVAHLARRHPQVPIIMAHLAGIGIQGLQNVQETPNVYVDTSGGQPLAGLVEYAVEKIGAKRILYGSDVTVRDFNTQIARVRGAKISQADKKLIFGKNAARLLKLSANQKKEADSNTAKGGA